MVNAYRNRRLIKNTIECIQNSENNIRSECRGCNISLSSPDVVFKKIPNINEKKMRSTGPEPWKNFRIKLIDDTNLSKNNHGPQTLLTNIRDFTALSNLMKIVYLLFSWKICIFNLKVFFSLEYISNENKLYQIFVLLIFALNNQFPCFKHFSPEFAH